jgi:hypothetical protein
MLPITETKLLIIRAQLNSSMFSEPYFRKLLPEMTATIRFRTVMKKKFKTIMLSMDISKGSVKLSESSEMIKAIKTIVGIKPIFKRVLIFSNRLLVA